MCTIERGKNISANNKESIAFSGQIGLKLGRALFGRDLSRDGQVEQSFGKDGNTSNIGGLGIVGKK